MSELSKRATVYFDPALHRALRVRAATSNQSVSELVDEAIRQMMKEDQEDLETYAARVAEPEIDRKSVV